MKIMTTQGGVRTTGASNQTSTGADESVDHSDGNPHPKASMEVVGRYPVTPERAETRMPGITSMGQGSFQGSDAAHEDMCKHPSKEYDPASITIPGLSKP